MIKMLQLSCYNFFMIKVCLYEKKSSIRQNLEKHATSQNYSAITKFKILENLKG